MTCSRWLRRACALLVALAPGAAFLAAQADAPIPESAAPARAYPAELLEAGRSAFMQQCAFCHGRDTGGGESGPDLTRSEIVAQDIDGSTIAPVIRNGQGEMPPFSVAGREMAAIVAFIHDQKRIAESLEGGRRGVETDDLKSGDIGRGRAYFHGAGRCAECHSATGDLAGIASKYNGLTLMRRTLYPAGAKPMLIVTTESGETVTGKQQARDEFTIALRDESGTYRSFFLSKVDVQEDAPYEAHVELLPKHTDDNLHDLMTYLLTLE